MSCLPSGLSTLYNVTCHADTHQADNIQFDCLRNLTNDRGRVCCGKAAPGGGHTANRVTREDNTASPSKIANNQKG